MEKETNYLTVGKHKGEWDFGVLSAVRALNYEEMKEFRQMIVVAIGTMENMWRDSQIHPSPEAISRELGV